MIAAAILNGGILNAFAPAIAAFVAKSPFSGFAGASIIKSGSCAFGSSPFSIARSIAEIIAFFSPRTAFEYISII